MNKAAPAPANEEHIFAQMQQIDLSTSLIDEREAAVDSIAHAVAEVNEAFKDVAVLVNEQQQGTHTHNRNT
jgi:hypothetical protein